MTELKNEKALWPNPILNKFPVSKSKIEKELGHVININTALDSIPPIVETLALLMLSSSNLPAGISYAIVRSSLKQRYNTLSTICNKLRNGTAKGVNAVVKYKAGPIYGFWELEKTYYETY